MKPRAKATGYGASKCSTALTAVALQDNLLRSYGNLSLANPLGHPTRKIGKPKPKRETRSLVDNGRGLGYKKRADPEIEIVLDPKPPPPTLAQKLGLVEQPKPVLNELEWQNLKSKVTERQDFTEPCVICKEDLGNQQHVLLSCSHVFHRNCLKAFERFTGRKTCPMCRHENYQTRVVHEGSKHYKHKCATRIQCTWRMYIVRSWYKKLRLTKPPKDPKLRKAFYEDKLHEITDRMVQACDNHVDDFLAEVDNSLAASRDVFRQFDELNRTISDTEWTNIHEKVISRGDMDCAICLNQLNVETATPVNQTQLQQTSKTTTLSSNTKTAKRKLLVLLSCSHLYHMTCLQSLEQFAVGEGRFVCPVCRSSYQKRPLHDLYLEGENEFK